ncbi:MAG: thioredoxin family protein [Bacteroidota bacterium]|nr:thioredoxin family protein [Bacteroidota bacterium]
MNFEDYKQCFSDILEDRITDGVYQDAQYKEYTKLNWSRQSRWMKSGVLEADVIAFLKNINQKMYWTVITEPWCGDAAHIVPFIELMSRENEKIEVNYELRDTAPFTIEKYLTNGAKSIPKLIVRDEHGNDLLIWGPRPQQCQLQFEEEKKQGLPMEQIKANVQKWYNQDKGKEIQQEITSSLQNILK